MGLAGGRAAIVVATTVSTVVGVALGTTWGIVGNLPGQSASSPQINPGAVSPGDGDPSAGSVDDTVFVGTELEQLLLAPSDIESVVGIGENYAEVDNEFYSDIGPSECSAYDGFIASYPAGFRQQWGSSSPDFSVNSTWVRHDVVQFPSVEDAESRFAEIDALTGSCSSYTGALNWLEDDAPGDVTFGPRTEGELPSLSGVVTVTTSDMSFVRNWAIVRTGNVISYLAIGHPEQVIVASESDMVALVDLIKAGARAAASTVAASNE